MFDPLFYAQIHTDLVNLSQSEALSHYLSQGIREGRAIHAGPRVIKIVLMTKNEWPLVKSWVLYHVHVFGASNIYVIDSSDQPEPILFLGEAEQFLGINVFRSLATLYQLESEINSIFTALNRSCDFITKADTDEFLVLYQNKTIVTDQQSIRSYFNKLPMNGSRYKLGYMTQFFPTKQCSSTDDPTLYTGTGGVGAISFKKFFAAWSYLSSDLGAHGGNVREPFDNSQIIDTDLAFAHYHFQCFHARTENSRKALVSLGYIGEKMTKEDQLRTLVPFNNRPCDFPCCHKVPEYVDYLLNESTARAQYYSRFSSTETQSSMSELMPVLWMRYDAQKSLNKPFD